MDSRASISIDSLIARRDAQIAAASEASIQQLQADLQAIPATAGEIDRQCFTRDAERAHRERVRAVCS